MARIRVTSSLGTAVLVLALAGCSDDSSLADSDELAATANEDDEADSDDSDASSDEDADSDEQDSGGEEESTAGSSDDDDDADSSDDADETAEDNGECGVGSFDSTFEAIQKVVFEGANCTDSKCHGAAAAGKLDLRADAAYDNLVMVKSANSSELRIMPGVPSESFLFKKLQAATEPGSVAIDGSPMPIGVPALSQDHLDAVRRWIEAGAPREGSVGDAYTGRSDGVAALLDSCLPPATPIDIVELPPPAAGEGVQLQMPHFTLPADTEVDVCFAQYFDLTDVVPKEFQNEEEGVFFVNGQRVRQDPHSHHFTLLNPGFGAEVVGDPSFGKWECRGGENDGKECDPLDAAGSCGDAPCASEVQDKGACIGFGPPGGAGIRGGATVATAQTAQYYRAPREGLYEKFPLRGLLYWNSHAFNLTSEPTQLDVWVNLFYATDPQRELETLALAHDIFKAAGIPPFEEKNVCSTWTAAQGTTMYVMGSHTHKRGRNFTVTNNAGEEIYRSALYSDPVEKIFEPPVVFDSADAAERTLTFCADFNNGVNGDGSPNLDLVTRLSTRPSNGYPCNPIACVAGKVGAPCAGAEDNASCDSEPGAGDGWCDACAITMGQTTEDEMFVLSPSVVLP